MPDSASDTPQFVLVPGAFAGGWLWEDVAGLLRDAGSPALVTEHLTTGEGAAGQTFAGDVQALRAVLDGLSEPVVLVAHSYGGAVVTAAAAGPHPKVRELIYVAGAAPASGESMASTTAAAGAKAGAKPGDPGPAPREDGLLVFPEPVARHALFGDCDDERAAEGLAQLEPQSFAGFDEPIPVAAWTQLPSIYVRATEDLVPRALGDGFLEACTEVIDLPTGHCPQWSQPGAVAELLLARAR